MSDSTAREQLWEELGQAEASIDATLNESDDTATTRTDFRLAAMFLARSQILAASALSEAIEELTEAVRELRRTARLNPHPR